MYKCIYYFSSALTSINKTAEQKQKKDIPDCIMRLSPQTPVTILATVNIHFQRTLPQEFRKGNHSMRNLSGFAPHDTLALVWACLCPFCFLKSLHLKDKRCLPLSDVSALKSINGDAVSPTNGVSKTISMVLIDVFDVWKLGESVDWIWLTISVKVGFSVETFQTFCTRRI